MMIMMYRAFHEREKKSQRYSMRNFTPQQSTSQSTSHSRKVAAQAMLYVLAYYITWIFPAVTWLTQAIQGKTYTPILMLQAFFVPLQGFFNAFIYLRPRYLRYRRSMPNASRIRVMLTTLSEGKNKQQIMRRGQNNGGEMEEDVGLDYDSDFHSLSEQSRRRKSFLQRIIGSSKRSSKSGSNECAVASENEKDRQVEIREIEEEKAEEKLEESEIEDPI